MTNRPHAPDPETGTATGPDPDPANSNDEPDPVMVIMAFATDQPAELSAVLARYVVLTRNDPACRNVDLVASATRPGHLVVIEKWDSSQAQQTHFDSAEMVTMAQACGGLLTTPPDIDLFDGISMHDLA